MMPAPALPTIGSQLYRRAAPAIARHDSHLRKHLAELPDPEEQAYHLTERLLIGLRTAWQGGHGSTGWRCETQYQRELSADGLCEARGPFLNAFGMAVRRVAMRGDA